jgi:glycerol-3-phosphate dehydrogenase
MTLRDDCLRRLTDDVVLDALVVGGGINGAVAAAALSGRGANVALIDRGDFAGVTSQSSSYLAWGGIKYLETYEFGLVRKLCLSRNHLLRALPSQVREMRFYVSLEKGFRHGRLTLFLGALLYWLIGNFFTRAPRLLTRSTIAREEPAIDVGRSVGGFEYSDALLPDLDARFVWSFVRRAISQGAIAANYVESEGATFDDGVWSVRLHDRRSGRRFVVKAKTLINAAGPYVDAHNTLTGTTTRHRHVFSKGIHLVVPRITPHERVLTFFADDGRLFFVIPMGDRTCVGTTDTRVDSPETHVTDDDRAFVLKNINARLKLERPLTVADVISERCGVRPLVVKNTSKSSAQKDWFQLSRKHVLEVDTARKHVSIFGGKLTDCVNIGEEICRVVDDLGLALPSPRAPWYGEPSGEERSRYAARARELGLGDVDALHPESTAARLWRRYGADAFRLLDDMERDPRAREPVLPGAPDLRCEAKLAAEMEMVTRLDDYLRRRTKLTMTIGRERLLALPQLKELARLLFGDDADEKLAEYADAEVSAPVRVPALSAAQTAASA